MTQLSLIAEPSSPVVEDTDSLVSVLIPPLDGEYLYSFSSKQHPGLGVGCTIEVRLGKRLVPGFVISTNSDREKIASAEMARRGIAIKPIPSDSRALPAFSSEHLEY